MNVKYNIINTYCKMTVCKKIKNIQGDMEKLDLQPTKERIGDT